MNSIRSMTTSLAVVVALTTSANVQARSAQAEPGTSNTATKQQQDGLITEVDWKSLARVGNHARIWLLRSFTETILLGHELYPHRSQRIQYVIDCTDRSYALSQWVLTDGENGAGQVVWADRSSALSFVKAAKGTIEAGVVHAACSTEPTRVAEHQLRFLLDSSPLDAQTASLARNPVLAK
jgi:hypothetical protein